MTEKNPLEPLVNNFVEILIYIKQNKDKMSDSKISKDIEAQLLAMEQAILLYSETQKTVLKDHRVAPEVLEKLLKEKEQLPSRDKRFSERLTNIKQEILDLRKQLKKEQAAVKLRQKKYGKKGDAKGIKQARKKKFKRLGGEGEWLPL